MPPCAAPPGLGTASGSAFVSTQAFDPYHQVEHSQMPCSRSPEPCCPSSPSVVPPLSLALTLVKTLAPGSTAKQTCAVGSPASHPESGPCVERGLILCALIPWGDALGSLSCPFLSEWSSHHCLRPLCVGIVLSVCSSLLLGVCFGFKHSLVCRSSLTALWA